MYSPHSRQHSVNSQGSLPRPGQLTRQDSRWTTITESGKSAKIQDESLKNMRRNAPPVSPLSPERVDHTQINSSSPNLTFEQSRTQIDPFYRHGEETIVKSDETVTIFGFPRNALMSIMQEFSSFGVILRYELDPNGGNWAHVQFENKFQAKRAKEQHGRIIGGIMIGVSSCLEAEINQQALDDSELRDQTAISSQSQTEKTFNSSSESRFGTMRNASVLSPLQNRTKIFNSPTGERISTPTKSNGMMSYLFGW